MILGIDYASIDGNHIDAAATGARFAYVRASAGMYTDPTWCLHRDAWAKVAPAGAYHCLAWHTDPIAQAELFIKCAGERRPGELPFALDVEADSAAALHLTPSQCLMHAEACLRELVAHYGVIAVYTSARVGQDVLRDLPSPLFASCPLWLKVPYPWSARNAPHLESAPVNWASPRPWQGVAPMAVQFQGDAIGLPGTTSTVDLNEFVGGPIGALLAAAGITGYQKLADGVHQFQSMHGLVADGYVGPKTYAALTASAQNAPQPRP